MNLFELCPEGKDNGDDCKKLFCNYRTQEGKCSLSLFTGDREYSVDEISEILQISRHRVWRIFNNVIDKCGLKVSK